MMFLFIFWLHQGNAIFQAPETLQKIYALQKKQKTQEINTLLDEIKLLEKQRNEQTKYLKNATKLLVTSVYLSRMHPLSFNQIAADEIPKTKLFQKLFLLRARKMSNLAEQILKNKEYIQTLQNRLLEQEKEHLTQLSQAHQAEQVKTFLHKIKGKILFPLPGGQVISQFGKGFDAKTQSSVFKKGIQIRVPLRRSKKQKLFFVKSVFDGKVIYSQSIPHFGHVVIVEHAQQLYSLFGSLKKPQKSLSQKVKKGDTLGIIEHSQPLYFELRYQNEPIDPLKWFAKF